MRGRDLGLAPSTYKRGRHDSITDVAGVRVGHANHHPDHTGVTIVVPHRGDAWLEAYRCGCATINGAGELSGKAQVEEWGIGETPIGLTATPYVGAVYHGLTQVMTAQNERIGRDDVLIPIVGECDSSTWCDMRDGPAPDADLVARALAAAASGAIETGQVGGGVGMESFGFAAGIGTASRRSGEYTVGVLVLANFGQAEHLRLAGRPVGRELRRLARHGKEGSCICLVATDAPLLAHELKRLARRPFLGLARLGGHASHGSGEIALAWTTANLLVRDEERAVDTVELLRGDGLSGLFAACVEATEAAVIDALCSGRELRGYDGSRLPRFPAIEVAAGT